MHRLPLRASLFYLATALVACTLAAAQTTGSLVGKVTCADSRTPCRYASVTIETAPARQGEQASSGSKPASHSYAAVTDLDGAFAMKNVIAGEYYVRAVEAGYLSPYDLAMNEVSGDASLKAKALDIALERVAVQAGQTTTANVLLSRGASLSGTVRYEDGGPAIGVSVTLFRKDGAEKWQPYTNTAGVGDLARLGFGPKTDDRGRFYVPGLPPGTYALQTSLPVTAMLVSSITGTQSLDFKVTMGGALRVFYGNLYRLKDAKVIELHEGEERNGLDINIQLSGLHTVRGFLAAKAQSSGVTAGSVELLDPDNKETLRETLIQPDGGFAFENVVNGSYLVRVKAKANDHLDPLSIRYETLTAPLMVEGDLLDLTYYVAAMKPSAASSSP